jgi:hypothetical protein
MSIMNVLRATGRGIGRLPRLIGDAMEMPEDYTQFQTPPFNPNAGTGVPDQSAPPPMDPMQMAQMQMPRQRPRLRPMMGDMVQGALAGMGTQNVAMGGPVDAARAAMAGMQAPRQRQMENQAMGMQQQRAATDQMRVVRDMMLDPLRKKQMEAQAEQARREAVAAQRSALLERGIAEHLATVHESLRPRAADYLRTVLPVKEWQDGEGLATAMAESLERFTGLAPESLKVVKGGTPPPKGQEPPPDGRKAFDYLEAIGR